MLTEQKYAFFLKDSHLKPAHNGGQVTQSVIDMYQTSRWDLAKNKFEKKKKYRNCTFLFWFAMIELRAVTITRSAVHTSPDPGQCWGKYRHSGGEGVGSQHATEDKYKENTGSFKRLHSLFRVMVRMTQTGGMILTAVYQLSRKSNPLFRMVLLVLNWGAVETDCVKYQYDLDISFRTFMNTFFLLQILVKCVTF